MVTHSVDPTRRFQSCWYGLTARTLWSSYKSQLEPSIRRSVHRNIHLEPDDLIGNVEFECGGYVCAFRNHAALLLVRAPASNIPLKRWTLGFDKDLTFHYRGICRRWGCRGDTSGWGGQEKPEVIAIRPEKIKERSCRVT